jgi:predicted nucleic acid-binding protein
MDRVLIDTPVIIDFLRGRSAAMDWLGRATDSGSILLYSAITAAEVAAGLRPGEERLVRAFLASLKSVPISEDVAWTGGDYLRRYTRSHGLEVPDAIIAASAKKEGAVLATLNVNHFPMKNLAVIRPY